MGRCPESLLRPTLQRADTNGRNSFLSAAHNQIFSVRWVAVDGLSTNVKLFGLADQLLCLPVTQALGFLVSCSYATRFPAVPDEAVMLR